MQNSLVHLTIDSSGWDLAAKKVADHPWARDLAEALEKDVLAWSQYSLLPTPGEPSGWTHNYFCPECGEPLLFDPERPDGHLAVKCGTVYTGEKYDGPWRTIVHNTNVLQMERCAVLLRLGIQPELARREILRFAREYPARYVDYQLHGHSEVLIGKMLPQSLDEAMWMITFLRSLRWSGLVKALTPAEQESITTMVKTVVQFMQDSIDRCPFGNITCWLLACVANCAAWLEDEALLEWCWSNPSGVYRQVTSGFDGNGQLYEGSPHYHFYALTALLSYFEVTGTAHLPPHLKSTLEAAFVNPLKLAYADGRLPAYNDAWPTLTYMDNADLYEVASHLFDRDKIQSALSVIYQFEKSGKPRTYSRSFNQLFGFSHTTNLTLRASVAALLFGEGAMPQTGKAKPVSALLGYSGIGILRNEHVRVAMRFGPYGGCHDHNDKLGVDVDTTAGWQSLDLGTSGYGAKITNVWQRAAAAHNTVMIDGIKQEGSAGCLLEWSETKVSAEAASAYAGVTLRRSLTLGESSWDDIFEIDSDHDHRIDWLFHGDGLFVPDDAGQPSEAVSLATETKNGLFAITTVQRLVNPGTLSGHWRHNELTQRTKLTLPENFDFLWGEAPGNPNGRPLGVILVRGKGSAIKIAARFMYK